MPRSGSGPASRPALFLALAASLLGGCVLWPTWHWAKAGASDADYARDELTCKQLVYTTADGMVTQAQVRRMHLCLESKGWHKAED